MDRSRPFGVSATGWKRSLTARVGFRRAFIEVTVAGLVLSLLSYLVQPLIGSPWTELLSYASLGIYALAAWRLVPGPSGLLLNAGRALLWALLVALVTGILGYLCLKLVVHQAPFLGINMAEMRLDLGPYLIGVLLFVLSPFVLTRTVLALATAGQVYLRWRLTYSYVLVAVLVTLLITPAQSLYIALVSLVSAPAVITPDVAAQRAQAALTPWVQRGATPDQLAAVLQGLFDGTVRLPLPPGETTLTDAAAPSFAGVHRLLLLDSAGAVLATSGGDPLPVGRSLPAAVATRIGLLVDGARAGACAAGRPANGSAADSAACPIQDSQGRVIATIVAENDPDSTLQFRADLNRVATIVLVSTFSTISLLFIALFGIVLLTGGSGYFLAGRVTRRLARLGAAAGDVAAGNLARRVPVESQDEIGRLSANFNTMAGRLQEREEALTAERDRAARLLASNRRLVADVSHELRTPLATLRGYLEALEQEHGDKLPAHDLAVIGGEVERLTSLIEDLFTLARAEAQQLPLTLESVDAGALLGRLAATVAPLARRERQIEVVTALPPDLPPVYADCARLEQVMLNLIQNALRYTLPGGVVAVEGTVHDGMVTLAVDDTGVGISAEELPLVFERFYRSDHSRARERGGAGIGLALVHELVTAMGGTVSVQSTPGRGSRFSVALRPAT